MLMLHCGGEVVPRTAVKAVPLPLRTKTYEPVGHDDFIEMIEQGIGDLIPHAKIADRQLGLARGGQHLFALWELESVKTDERRAAEGDDSMSFCIGARNSYDKSLRAALAGGGKVFVCDNLMFQGSDFMVSRKHTKNVWRDLRTLIAQALTQGPRGFRLLNEMRGEMKGIEMDTNEGYQTLGLMQGHGLLRSQQATIAFREWDKPTHEEFAARNLWSFFNCCTEALKKGQATDVIGRHIEVTAFCKDLIPVPVTLPDSMSTEQLISLNPNLH